LCAAVTDAPAATEFEAPGAAQRLRLSLGRRGIALLLALAVEIGVAILLLFLWPTIAGKPDGDKAIPTTFSIDTGESDEAEQSDSPQDKAEAPSRPAQQKRTEPKPKPPEPQPTPDPVPEPEVPVRDTFIRMTRRDYADADIAKTPARNPGTSSADTGDSDAAAGSRGGGARPGDSAVAGKAPNGEPLYAAEWYRRPTHAELNTYMSRRAQTGWGLIACRTIANYRVEDCQELGESPRGSGLAGSVRQAAWQFRVRPPRVGGKEQVGAWVSIRIDYTLTRE
jgi:hypothetical protein